MRLKEHEEMRKKLRPWWSRGTRPHSRCCDCGTPMDWSNVSRHQPIRCMACFDGFAKRTSDTLQAMIDKAENGERA